MDPTDSHSPATLTAALTAAQPQQQPQRSILAIDLNEIPSPIETLPSPTQPPSSSTSNFLSPTSLVRSFHDHHPPAEGSPAEIPGESSNSLSCSACGGPPSEGPCDRLVCDGCERGFHFRCAGVGGGASVDEWVCRDCVAEGVRSRRWPLGRRRESGGVRLLDMNASPPSDGDGDGGGVRGGTRKLSLGDNTFGGYTSDGPLAYSNFIYSGNGFGFHKAPAIVTHTVRLDFQDILHHRRSTGRSFEEITYSSQLGRIRSSTATLKLPPWNSGDVLQSLREFVSERHGILEEGWRVEFKQSKNGCESYAVFCAPDGKMFETMSDVAFYLGLASDGNPVEPETRNDDGSALRRNGLHLPKRRKLTRLPIGNGFSESRDSLMSGVNNGFSSNMQTAQFSIDTCGKTLGVTEAVQEESGANDFHQFHEGLPLQYEDFFILSLGKVDARASYHDTNQIWPVGYRSCWHDKITGSLFLCDVLDGGDTGPVFKARRFSCSTLPIPYGSTILHRQSCPQSDSATKEGEKVNVSDEECSVNMFLSDPCFPAEGDTLSWLLSGPSEVDGQKASESQPEAHSSCERSQDLLAHNTPVGEMIGELSVDGRSSSLVWSILSEKLADACHQIYKQSGSMKFFCKHVKDGMSSFYDVMNEKNKETFSSLDKFCSLLGSLKVPSVVKSDDELDSTVEALKTWMSLDRFGLDTEFVQELIEQSPEVHRCSQYESLKRRKGCSRLPLVGNGFFLINGKSLEQCEQDSVLDGLYREYKADREPALCNHCNPPGKHLGMKLPPHLVGDVLQIWELLCRFHEILGLEPLNFDDFEAELIRPWFESVSQRGSCDRDSPGCGVKSANGSSVLSEQASSSSSEVDRPEDNRFIEMENAVTREEAHARLALSSYSKCACVSLRKAHISLLDVLVSELQIKVVAVVDPSIDGESKSRRGRKRDVDSSILAIRPKLNLLPINELTWPELARRYILALMSMDGNLDGVETGVREFGKVFRCLQGDGGILCGSLVGVAGIEADALLLAEATKRIYGSPSSERNTLVIEDDDPEPASACGKTAVSDGGIPEWAQALEPVRKLPTNVGTRIRKCVYEALEKDPPDWARKILEHSISKEVYKGNASGPTKKAVLSVLADVASAGAQQKIRIERRKKTIVSISDIIMKKCRILLRRAASADEEKIFCNLLGRNLLNSSENDEEGLLGSPATVSRALDFRTIDLRLAVGAYGGSHEAFLEDVRELWKNIRTAHAEQPDLVELADTLSQNFESLYEEEVLALVLKLKEHSELVEISPEAKKEIRNILASTSEIPKAPWDEGVCKVCGVDRDDDSVLLCDTCDAEYHTYCLNPPLARIPEGNWYCPSCRSGVSMLQGTSRGAQFVGQRHRRKNLREGIRNYLDELGRLAAVLEQKEYWEFSVEERILLLKFLCDEVLNSILIRQNLEQCSEMSADLQQKLRLLYSEWKNLKLREDLLNTKAAKLGLSVPIVAGDANIEGRVDIVTSHNTSTGLQAAVSERCNLVTSLPDNTSQEKGAIEALNPNNQDGGQTVHLMKKNVSCSGEAMQSVDLECQVEDNVGVVNEDGTSFETCELHERRSKRHKTSSVQESSVSNTEPHEAGGIESESSCQLKSREHTGADVSPVCKSEDKQGASISSGCPNSVAVESIPCSNSNQLQAYSLDLTAVQKDLSSLQQSIGSAESQLLKSSVRMEFLGSDCSGRLYWVLAQPDAHPWVIVDGTIALQPKTQGMANASMTSKGSYSKIPAHFGQDSHLSFGGSSVPCPFDYGRECSTPTCSQWFSYESDTEIRELVKSLRDCHPKERELKDSIMHWQKLRFHEFHQTGKQDQTSHAVTLSADKNDVSNLLITKAFTVLERIYGPFFQADKVEHLKKRSKRSRGNDEKLYRCQCLEPIWPSRNHCPSCHGTFFTAEELEKHNDGNCQSSLAVSGKKRPSDEQLIKKPEIQQFVVGKSVQASKSAGAELSSLIKFQNEESMCPFKFDEISSKFVTNDSIKELVHGIGLIGSEGTTPSFVPSASSPYLSDPALAVIRQEGGGVSGDQCKIPEKVVGQVDQITGKDLIENVTDNSHRRSQANKQGETSETGQSLLGVRDEVGKFLNPNFASSVAGDPCCTVPESSLRPLVGRGAQMLRQLKISLLDMEAALPEEALRALKVCPERRRAWHAFVKAAETIFEMVQATIVLEDMIKSEFLKNEWWYWSSLSAAAKTSTLSSLALRIYALDNAIVYERSGADLTRTGSLKPSGDVDQQSPSNLDSSEKSRQSRRASKKRKEADS